MALAPAEASFVDVDGLRTSYTRKGSGPPLVLLHGQSPGSCWEVHWPATIDHFATDYDVYAFDQVGFGRTANRGDFSMAARVAHAKAFLAAMGLSRCVLWGQSSGTEVALRIALEDSRVGAVIGQASGSLSPPDPDQGTTEARRVTREMEEYTPTVENARAHLMAHIMDKRWVTHELVQRVVENSSGANFEAHQARFQAPRLPSLLPELGHIKVPVLLLWGRNDTVTPRRGLLLQAHIPSAELHVFDNCGHWVQLDAFDRVNAVVRGFLAGLL
ncbi:MAG TPA: alpha/beta hydrolase [Chloroflexota bacterium]